MIDETPISISKKEDPRVIMSQDDSIVDLGESVTTSAASEVQIAPVMEQVNALWSAIKNPGVWKPALFLFLWQSTPTGEGAFLYFMTNDLGFGPEFLGRVRLVTAASGLVGVWVYQKYLRTVSFYVVRFPNRTILFFKKQ